MSESKKISDGSERYLRVGMWQARLFPARAYQAHYVASSATIGFAFDSQTGVHAHASDRIRPFRANPDSLAFVPQNCDVFSESMTGGEYLCLSHDVSIPGVGAMDINFNNVTDIQATKAARAIRYSLLQPDPANPSAFRHHANCLAECVSKRLLGKPSATSCRTSMTESRLRFIDRLIEERLGENLAISLLANSVGVSEGYFSRAFRDSVGKTPFDYIIDRRVMRARQLILQGDSDLSAIANTCGFSSHSHMTETFRRRIGLSPSQLRKAY